MATRTFLCFPEFKEKAVTFSYDDGVIYDPRLIEIFVKNGLKGTFNISSGKFGMGRIMSKDQAVELYTDSGMEVAVHGYNHLSLANVDVAVATNDVLTDRKMLEEIFGRVIKGMAYANGSLNDKVVEILKNCGISYSRTAVQTGAFDLPDDWLRWNGTCHHDNPNLMEYVENFLSAKRGGYFWSYRPRVLYVWGHSYEFNDKNNWERIEQLAEFIGGREDIWYATNGEIYDYVTAYDNLKWGVNCKFVHNPTATDVYINYFNKKVVVKAGQTVEIKD